MVTLMRRRVTTTLAPVEPILAVIDVGTNAVRLEIARVLPDGSLETLHEERDPVRPGEGLFTTGVMPPEVVDRLLSTLRRYASLCRRYGARVRAVATSAVREAKNRPQIVRRVKDEAGLLLEVISGQEEARLVCLGVLKGASERKRSLLIDIGGGSTEVATSRGETPEHLWSLALGAVRVTQLFESQDRTGPKRVRLMREFAAEAFSEAIPPRLVQHFKTALGSSGTIGALVRFAADSDNPNRATSRSLTRAVERLADMKLAERRKHFESRRAEIIVGGAVVLEQAMQRLGLESITAVSQGLRHGLLVDLLRRSRTNVEDHSLGDAALVMAERFGIHVAHGKQTAKLALRLFDELAALHKLPAATRPLLEASALLHDVGHAVNYQKHHRHTYYLIRNSDLPVVSDGERELVALTARFHRRSPPENAHPDLQAIGLVERGWVRKLSTLLRMADSLDRSHHAPVRDLRARIHPRSVDVTLYSKVPLDLELWDAAHEAPLFQKVFGRKIGFTVVKR